MITTEQLNEVADLLGTDDKALVFSAVLATLIDAGHTVDAAFDMLFGEGAYMRYAGQVYAAITGMV